MTPDQYRRERIKRGTQKAVADALGVHRMTITQRESGVQHITREAWLALLSLPKSKMRKSTSNK